MPRNKPDIQWIFQSEEEARRSQLSQATSPNPAGGENLGTERPRWWAQMLRGGAVTLLIIVMAGAILVWKVATEGVKIVDQEVQAAIEVDAWRSEHAVTTLPATTTPAIASARVDKTVELRTSIGGIPSDSTVTLQDITLHNALAVAAVLRTRTNHAGETKTYRELHFYQQKRASGYVQTQM